MSCSIKPNETPRSSRHDAYDLVARPAIAANAMGNIVTACNVSTGYVDERDTYDFCSCDNSVPIVIINWMAMSFDYNSCKYEKRDRYTDHE